ncbi:type I-B CRISPR-associated protein Cas8b1/Cst1 [Clostridium fermenticellae]|uniref:Type I-B CRISPR-associated protein Cas8b1/Cst1 n=1 Tax=Clostridium fermenticellae TaxID=2068654 RepID=A0A386H3S7_9CLOT|nr:type I-B CRISPR-associated protein Cas8b1/Cst1 [Clostridium fermenticellae]AYD40183.1 type I-B CRISPR-associated protein Cas8b1/Cst1 [Clostridium fermenticellae]
MTTIKLKMSDWLYNAGLVGLIKILNQEEISYNPKGKYFEFEADALVNFEEKYFKYFSRKYKRFTSWYKIVSFEDYIINFDKNKVSDKNLETINNYIENIKKKLTSNSYKSAYLLLKNPEIDLLEKEKKLKKIKKTKKQNIKDVVEEICNQLNNLKLIINYLKRDDVKRIIIAKNIIYNIIQQFWSDVSFLNRNNSKNDMFQEYKTYFIDGVLNYAEAEKKKYKYDCFTCDNKISKLSKPKAYDLTWLSKIGVDMSRKSSHFWNFNGDSYICPVCNLVYSCVPAGFTILKGKGLFINQNSSIEDLFSANTLSLEGIDKFQKLEEQGYFNIVKNIEQGSVENFNKEIENIQVVKYDFQNVRRPYSFNLLSKSKLVLIYKNRKRLSKLINVYIKISKDYYINLYSEVLERLYNNKNQFSFINYLLSLNLEGKFNGIGFIYLILKINHDFLQGGMRKKMTKYKNKGEYIDTFERYGLELRSGYSGSSKNKISGITYRLLNSLKIKNTSKFMETLINAYLYLNSPIPTDFIGMLKDENKFQEIGYAFLIGLQGYEEEK